ncbi:flavohemoprotein, partial [Streptomyces sp. MCAF7]
MDAPTTTPSAGNDGAGGNSGDWGWFTPPKKRDEDASPGTDQDDGRRAPSRPVSPIRPVGTGAGRRTPPPPPAPAPPVHV